MSKSWIVLVIVAALTLSVVATVFAQAPAAGGVTLSEIRADQTGTDYDEYFELAGPGGASLAGLTYLVIGDGTGGSGVIEAVVDLSGQSVPTGGYFVAAESTFTLGTPDLAAANLLNFENSDNVTHLLVEGFTGALNDDLDTNDDGVLDITPWTTMVDCVSLFASSLSEKVYCADVVGPDGIYAPGHVFSCDKGWQIGAFDVIGGDDTPGAANACPAYDISVGKTAPGFVAYGEVFTYTLTAGNDTGMDLTDLVISDTLPLDVAYKSSDPTGNWGAASHTITWTVPSLSQGADLTYTIVVTAPDVDATLVNKDYAVWALNWFTPTAGAAVQTDVSLCTSIYNVQYTTDPGTDGLYPSPCVDRMARVRGVVYWVSGNRYFMAESSGPWRGIYVYGISGYTPVVGDEVEVTGTVREYYGLTEFSFPTTSFVSSGNPLPGATVVTAAELPYGIGSLSEAYEGVLVEAHNIEVTALEAYNVWAFTDASGGTAKADDWFYNVAPAVGNTFVTLRGPVVYDLSEYKIVPRGALDVAAGLFVSKDAPTNVAAEELVTYTLSVINDTGMPLTQVMLTDAVPVDNATFAYALDGGTLQAGNIVSWTVAALDLGASASVRFVVTATGDLLEEIWNTDYAVWAAEWPEPVSGAPVLTVIGDYTPIYQIQGAGFQSPYEGAWVTTVGVVLGRFEGNTPSGGSFNGFYIQDQAGDGDATTSDGILVNHGAVSVMVGVGDVVTVTGWVDEYNDYGDPCPACETQIVVDGGGDIDWSGTAPLPAAVVLDPPGDPSAAQIYFEALEGMTVTLPLTGAVVGPTSYGTIMVVPGDEGIDRVLRGSAQQGMIFGVRPEERYGAGAPQLIVGSVVSAVNGPLAYTYGNYVVADQDGYGVPYAQPEPVPAPSWPTAAANEFTVATFNTYNYFDNVNDPLTSDPVESLVAYTTHKAKLAATIAQAGCPLLVAMQEVENLQVLQDLAAVLAAVHGCAYTPYLLEGLDGRGIDVGMLAASDRVLVESVAQYQDCTTYDTGLGQGTCAVGEQLLYSRLPLVVTATVQHGTFPEITNRVVLIANHLKSKLSTEGDPESAQWRLLQAESLAQFVDDLAAVEPETYLIVLGDLNDFEDSPPLDALYASGVLTNIWYTLPAEARYSYIYNGVSQVLDHILISPSLQTLLQGAFPVHVNADFPYSLYADNAAVPFRSSDHDLVAATFLLGLPEIVSLDLVESEDQITWSRVTGDLDSGFTMTLSCAVPVYVLNTGAVETNNPLLAGYYGFLLDPGSVPEGFYDYWAASGVVEGATGWRQVMWEIINGRSPMFYLRVTDGAEGKEFMLVDGFQKKFGADVDKYWQMVGNYPAGAYRYVGVIEDEYRLTNTVELDLTLLAPALAITKAVETAHVPVHPGDAVTYTVVVANNGSATAVDVHLTDVLPAGVTGSNLDWTVTISTGEEITFTIPAVVDADPTLYGQTITNTASYNYLDCDLGSATASFQVGAAIELSIFKDVQVLQEPVYPGDSVTYSIAVTNDGLMTALGVVITDVLPLGVDGQDLTWSGDIGAGERVEFAIPATVSLAPEFRGATITNTVYYQYDGVKGWDDAAFAVSSTWRTYLPIISRFQ